VVLVADDRTLLHRGGKDAFHRGVVRADIRKINGAMAGAGDTGDAGVGATRFRITPASARAADEKRARQNGEKKR